MLFFFYIYKKISFFATESQTYRELTFLINEFHRKHLIGLINVTTPSKKTFSTINILNIWTDSSEQKV